ncbi:MAG: ABC transporter permease [Thermoprotei archaeon]|nr:MAG: ABC transporter permease [Thermoprotei archaeon]RLE94336.1 MAG: ABC transporter permease [Thermoprotei archaeon]
MSFKSVVGKIYRNFLVRRILRALGVIFVTSTLTFFIIRLMPSNPIEIFINQMMAAYGMSYQDAKALALALFTIDLDKPLHQQYIEYLINLFQGNLGRSISISPGTPVMDIILAFLPWTLFSVSISILASFVLGVITGIIAAYRRGGLFDKVMSTFAAIISAIPGYLIGILIIVFIGVQYGLINYMRGAYSAGIRPGFNLQFISDVFLHLAAPFATYVLSTFGGWMLSMKASTISTLGEDYVTVAKAKGLPESRIRTQYVGRNAILPLFTSLAIQLGFIFGGSVLIENIFVYRGVGRLLWSSINARDYTVMQAVFLIITISVVVSNLLADLIYGLIDPRVRVGE